jgi:hypothetical protein
MNQEAYNNLLSVLIRWYRERFFTYHLKKVFDFKNPDQPGEAMLIFRSELHNYKCNNIPMPISLISEKFYTGTLRDKSEIENGNGDVYRLTEFLKAFDEHFNNYAQSKIDNCIENLDPLGVFNVVND